MFSPNRNSIIVDVLENVVTDNRVELLQGGGDSGDALEHAALEHVIGKLNIECALKRQHHVHTCV